MKEFLVRSHLYFCLFVVVVVVGGGGGVGGLSLLHSTMLCHRFLIPWKDEWVVQNE
jgi:hypothetical protein